MDAKRKVKFLDFVENHEQEIYFKILKNRIEEEITLERLSENPDEVLLNNLGQTLSKQAWAYEHAFERKKGKNCLNEFKDFLSNLRSDLL